MSTATGSSAAAKMVAIARRDLAIELSYHFQFMLRVAQMLFVTTTLYFVSKLVQNPEALRPYGGHYFEFVVIGLVVGAFVTLGLGAFSRTISDEQRAGTLEMLLSAPTSLATLLAGSLVVPMALTTLQMIVHLTVAITLFGADLPLSGLPVALPILVLTIATFCAMGMLSASFIVLTKRGDPFTLFAAQASTFLAGTLFPTSVLPGPVEALTRLVPAFYGLKGLRDALLGDAGIVDVADEIAVLAGFCAVLLPVALMAFSRALRAARVTGTLGNY